MGEVAWKVGAVSLTMGTLVFVFPRDALRNSFGKMGQLVLNFPGMPLKKALGRWHDVDISRDALGKNIGKIGSYTGLPRGSRIA